MKTKIQVSIIFVLLFSLMAAPAMSQGIKERISARLPVISKLKDAGVVGENNQGFLEFRGAPQQAETVKAENADRALIYEAIAKKAGSNAAAVGQKRAMKYAQKAHPGTWLQDPKGQWYRK